MSEPRVAALVCEGQTDIPIFRSLIQKLWPSVDEVRALQPEIDDTSRATRPAGWTEVKAWCQQHADSLAEVVDPFVGDPIDLLLIAVDLDIAIEAKIADPPQSVGVYEASRLRTVVEGWLTDVSIKRLPPALVISTPVMAVESWIIAALYPKEKGPESIQDPTTWLLGKGKLRKSERDGKVWKELHRYQSFAPRIASGVARVRKVCQEADRTFIAIEQRRDEVEFGERPS